MAPSSCHVWIKGMEDTVCFELEVVRWNDTNGVTTSKRTYYTAEVLLMRLREVVALKDLAEFTVKRHGR